MRFTGITVMIYSLIVLAGGLIGYLKADSLPSLIAGSVFGAILFAGGMGILKNNVIAFFSALAASGLLSVFFNYRYWQTAKMMPSGMMGILSVIIFLLLLTTKAKRL